MFQLSNLDIISSAEELNRIPQDKCLVNTVNANSYNVAQRDETFAQALIEGDFLLPDGASIVKACRWLGAKSQPRERVAGWDLFCFLMRRNATGRVFFLGSSPQVLEKIRERCSRDFPQMQVDVYSPPYKPEFSEADNAAMIEAVNRAAPDLLWIGMTAPKQEKWAHDHWQELHIACPTGTIGAVFDFYAGTVRRAPLFWQRHSLEWLYRLLSEPRRMWRRYLIGNPLFIYHIIREKYNR